MTEAILDTLVHHAHRITLAGGSLRRLTAPDPADPTAHEPRVRAFDVTHIDVDRTG